LDPDYDGTWKKEKIGKHKFEKFHWI